VNFYHEFRRKSKLFKVIKESVGDKIHLIAGTCCISTINTIALSKKAEELGYKMVMVSSPPYYTKPTQSELYNHFKKVADSINIQMTF